MYPEQPIESERAPISIDHLIPDVHISVYDMTMISGEYDLMIRNRTGEIHLSRQQLESLIQFSRHFLHKDWS